MPKKTDGTYVKYVKYPTEILPPSGDSVFVAIRVEESRCCVSFALLGDIILNASHGPDVETLVSELLGVRDGGSTHVVSWSIAESTDRLSSSDCLPSKPRSRALHTSAQVSPSST